MRTLFCWIVLSLCTAALSVPVLGWDDVGHKTTAYIAWQRMSPEAREAVIRILRAAAEDSDLSVYYQSYGAEPEQVRKLEYFMLASTWADIVRDRALETRYRKYHHSNWHYDDMFWKQISGGVELLRGFDEGGVAVDKLVEFDKVIRNASANDKDKAIAIAWIMHLIGDLHQPLHTSARVTDTEPKGDQGGNLFLITPEGTPRESQQNIHWFWDSIVVRNIPLKGETCERDYIESIAKRIMKRHPFTSVSGILKLGAYEDWRNESFAYNATDVFSPDLVRFQTPSEKYKRNALRVAEQRLALAGYRLGETLNKVFGAPPAVATTASCRVIRTIMYPVFKKQTPENRAKAKPTISLLDVCPTGPASRPTIMLDVDGRRVARAFDVVSTFPNETVAREYAAANAITDLNFALQ